MEDASAEVLQAQRGLIVAPAGCGKTHLITEVLRRADGNKPALILTHTNAGVCALRERLKRVSVLPSAYHLYTIDGWALKLASMFPQRSRVPLSALTLCNPPADYPRIRESAEILLRAGDISSCLEASYSRLLVDEYQDCSVRQHRLICQVAAVLPTCVMGDRMQSIFGLNSEEPLVPWGDVTRFFPCILELGRPWRWINAGAEPIGAWLVSVRRRLEACEPIDLRKAPLGVKWVELKGDDSDHPKIVSAAKWTGRGSAEGVLIIADSRNAAGRHWLARMVQGAEVVEPVELKQMVDFFRTFTPTDVKALDSLCGLCEDLAAGLGRARLLRRVETIINGTARKAPCNVEQAAVDFERLRTPAAAAGVLMAVKADPAVRVYRPTVLQCCIRTLLNSSSRLSLQQSAAEIREQFRSFGRRLPARAIGSTLLLKGLEAGAAVIINAHKLDARNLYVALTRGAKAVVVCSTTAILDPPM